MDLIYMNNEREDVGVLNSYELDLAYGADENNFECTIGRESHCCNAGYYLYVDGTEYGGIIDGIQVNSESDEIVYSGRTWHGILGSKIITPLKSGESGSGGVSLKTTDANGVSLVDKYLVISGDANACLGVLVKRIGLSDLFSASTATSGATITQYQFYRYCDAYTGIVKMLASAGLKLKTEFTDDTVRLSAVPKYDYSEDEEFDSELVGFKISRQYNAVNHLICLGKGELDERTVVHLYADANGNVSSTQSQFGLDEYADTYDYANVESVDELIASGTEQLQSLWGQNEIDVSFDGDAETYDVGDVVGAYDTIAGIAVSATICKKIIKIDNGRVSISYEVGE